MPATLVRLPQDVTDYALGHAHNNFAIVTPEATINLIVNPSFENAANWAFGWGSTGTVNWQASAALASHGRGRRTRLARTVASLQVQALL